MKCSAMHFVLLQSLGEYFQERITYSLYIFFFIQLQPNKCLNSQIESEGLCNSNGTIFASF